MPPLEAQWNTVITVCVLSTSDTRVAGYSTALASHTSSATFIQRSVSLLAGPFRIRMLENTNNWSSKDGYVAEVWSRYLDLFSKCNAWNCSDSMEGLKVGPESRYVGTCYDVLLHSRHNKMWINSKSINSSVFLKIHSMRRNKTRKSQQGNDIWNRTSRGSRDWPTMSMWKRWFRSVHPARRRPLRKNK